VKGVGSAPLLQRKDFTEAATEVGSYHHFKMVAERLPVAPKLSVNIVNVEKILPEKQREDHVYTLTNLDQNTCMLVKTVNLYDAKEEVKADPAKVMKDALVKLLDYYYPLAGRLGISVYGKLQVNYNSQGVIFVEAATDSTLADLGDISHPDERLEQLVYTDPNATNVLETPLVTAQVMTSILVN
jgi:omega-hydroxypalmitate O-feruloyl transferase